MCANLRHILISLCMLSLPAIASSAGPDRSSRLLAEFDSLFTDFNHLILQELKPRLDFGETYTIFHPTVSRVMSEELDDALRNRTLATISEGNSRTGLQITGQTYWRLDNSLGFDEDDAESRYRFKFQGELRWYFLQSSLFGRQGRRAEANLKEQIERAVFNKERSDISDYQLRDNLRIYYDSLMAGVIQHRLRALTLISDAQDYLLANENISSDELMPILDSRMEAERKLSAIDGTYPLATDLSRLEGYTVEIDTAAIMAHVRDTQADINLLRLRMQLLEQQAQNVSYWQSLNLAPFVRFSYYGRSALPDSRNVDIGMTFTIPLSGESSRKRQAIRAESRVLGAQEAYISSRIADKVAFISRELARLNRESEAEGRRILEMKKYIARRTDAYANRIGEFNRLARTKEYNLYLLCFEKLIDYQYRRDTYLAELQALVPDVPVMSFCLATPLADTLQ